MSTTVENLRILQLVKDIFTDSTEKIRILNLLKNNPVLGQFELLLLLRKEVLNQINTDLDIIKNTVMKGDKGDVPIRGIDYLTPHEIEQFVRTIQNRIRTPTDGNDGYTPIAGKDYPTKKQIQLYIEQHIPVVKNGKTPVKGIDYFTEQDIQRIIAKFPKQEKLTGRQIVQKVNELEIQSDLQIDASHIKNLPKMVREAAKRTIHRGGSQVNAYDLSASTDGITKTFTIPAFSLAVAVFGSDFPVVYRPTVDWTASGTILTLTGEVPAPTSGATLIFLYNS